MTEVVELLKQLATTRDCTVMLPSGQPGLREQDHLPRDLAGFYLVSGGVSLYAHSDHPVRIVGPAEFVRSNPVLVGEDAPDDISDSWYIVARGGPDEAISIDCHPGRLGRCYDSFWDCHGVAGSCKIVALSFTELLRRLLHNRGEYWYWLADDAPAYGDAYQG